MSHDSPPAPEVRKALEAAAGELEAHLAAHLKRLEAAAPDERLAIAEEAAAACPDAALALRDALKSLM